MKFKNWKGNRDYLVKSPHFVDDEGYEGEIKLSKLILGI